MKLSECTKVQHHIEGENYIVEVEYPSGRRVSILVPTTEDEEDCCFIEDGSYRGLNLVSMGHYL